jgi:hypothetical protein
MADEINEGEQQKKYEWKSDQISFDSVTGISASSLDLKFSVTSVASAPLIYYRSYRDWHAPIPEGCKCENCNDHVATMKYSEQPISGLELAHGASYDYWCEQCVLKSQIKWAKETIETQTKRLPELEAKLMALEASGSDASNLPVQDQP